MRGRMAHDKEQAEIDAAIEAAWENNAVPHPRGLQNAAQYRILKGHRRDVALEKWGPEIEEMILRDLVSDPGAS
jgi:hypothetical protein